jgi:hypothetical protein
MAKDSNMNCHFHKSMGCNPSHWLIIFFQDGYIKPPTSHNSSMDTVCHDPPLVGRIPPSMPRKKRPCATSSQSLHVDHGLSSQILGEIFGEIWGVSPGETLPSGHPGHVGNLEDEDPTGSKTWTCRQMSPLQIRRLGEFGVWRSRLLSHAIHFPVDSCHLSIPTPVPPLVISRLWRQKKSLPTGNLSGDHRSQTHSHGMEQGAIGWDLERHSSGGLRAADEYSLDIFVDLLPWTKMCIIYNFYGKCHH